jgi:hypothetical protein
MARAKPARHIRGDARNRGPSLANAERDAIERAVGELTGVGLLLLLLLLLNA